MTKKSYVKNAADPKQVKAAEERIKLEELTSKGDLISLLNLPEGKRFIWKLLSRCGIFESSFNHSGSIMYFNEGKRQIGLQLLSEITDHYPEAMINMMTENKTEK